MSTNCFTEILKKCTLMTLQKDLFLSDTKLMGLDFGVSGVRDEIA